MSILNDVFYGNLTLLDLLKDGKGEVELLHEIAFLREEINTVEIDSEIIKKIENIIELNDQYFLMKSFDAFKLGVSFTLDLLSESKQFN